MNFTQWKKYAARKDISKITYVCGVENTLRELVIQDIVQGLDIDAAHYIESSESKVWEDASQYPLDTDKNRLTVVRGAESINSWTGLAEWLNQSKYNPKNYIVFVADQDDAPSIFDKGKRAGYAAHIELIRNKGKFIRCSQPNQDDLIIWCQSFSLNSTSAEYLIQRTSSDVTSMYNVLRKLRIWNGSPNTNVIKLLSEQQIAKDSFCDHLILGDKESAYLAAREMSSEDMAKAISKLDTLLDYLLDINRCISRRMYDTDIVANTGIKIFLVKKFKGVAKDYNALKVRQCRQIITLIDSALQSGISEGSMERLIVLW